MASKTYGFINLYLIYLLICIVTAYPSSVSTTEICDKGGNCYPKLFEATKEFKEILEGQEIPRGLHIKIDFETGKKYAKLLDPSDSGSSSEVVLFENDEMDDDDDETFSQVNTLHQQESLQESLKESLKESLHDTLNLDNNNNENRDRYRNRNKYKNYNYSLPIIQKKPQPQPVPSQRHKENNRISHSDHLLFDNYISQLIKSLSSSSQQQQQSLTMILSALDGLEELVHELDFGIKLSKGEGLKSIISLLNHDSNEIKKKAALVIGAAMQNNPLAQSHALRMNLIPRLLNSLSSEEGNDIKVLSRLLYALSSIVRGNRAAMKIVNDNDGLSLLAILYEKLEDNEFRAKCALFITDFIDPNMVVKAGESDDVFDQQQQQGNSLLFSFSDVIRSWCELFQFTLINHIDNVDDDDDDFINKKSSELDFDTKEKILRGISMIRKYYPLQCPAQNKFMVWLSEQADLVKNEDYLEDYDRLISQVRDQYNDF
ncbi:hypothetical protein Glove_300g57 [Diversispora epigaea]|uniref:Nucleotide exchange factor SIL1 n=1 Tax=Diversispora epigaea TaxID=1348612 RepID=A0A397I2M4_9GLOM|nr:hypothetical protein Glove_300g57 [Diversispora epigaea]